MLYSNNVVPLHVPITTVMPRQTRKKSGAGIYHVMLRGINRSVHTGARLCRLLPTGRKKV